MEEEGEEEQLTEEILPNDEIKVYKERWLMLFLFSLITFTNGVLFIGLSSVVETVAPYYKVTTVEIEWLSNIFLIVFIVACMPSAYIASRFGTRSIVTFAAACNAISLAFHYAGCIKGNFYLMRIGQFIGAVGYANMLEVPGKLSADWFPPHERGLTTGVGVCMNIFGVAVGFLQTSMMIPTTSDPIELTVSLRLLFLLRMIVAFATFVATAFFFKDKPPTPPSIVQGHDKMTFLASVKHLAGDLNFILVSQAYGLYFGIYVCVSVVLSLFVSSGFGLGTTVQIRIGWMGFAGYIVAGFGIIVTGLYLDRYPHHKLLAIVLNAASLITWIVFILTLLKSNSLDAVFAVYLLYSLFCIPYFSCGVEQVAEMTSPVSEGISSTVILLFGNAYGFVLILVVGRLMENGYPVTSLCLILTLYVVTTFLVSVAKTELKRSAAEQMSLNDSAGESPRSSESRRQIADEEIESDYDEKDAMLEK